MKKTMKKIEGKMLKKAVKRSSEDVLNYILDNPEEFRKMMREELERATKI